MTSTRFHATVERWTAGSGWTDAFLAVSAGGLSQGKGDSTHHWKASFVFCCPTLAKRLLEWGFPQPSGWGSLQSCWPTVLSAEGKQSHGCPALFFFLFFLFFLLCFPVGGFVLFCLLVSLRRKLLLGQRADGCPAPGRGLPMNVRLKSPAKGMSRVLATPTKGQAL